MCVGFVFGDQWMDEDARLKICYEREIDQFKRHPKFWQLDSH